VCCPGTEADRCRRSTANDLALSIRCVYCPAVHSRILTLIAYAAFIALGLPDTVLGVAWPQLRSAFHLPPSAMGAVLVAGTCGYFCSGLLAGAISRRLGIGGVLTLSSGLISASLLGYAAASSWTLFLLLGVVVGLGSGAVDASLNDYAARHFSARSLNWLHACWGIGASLGPTIMTAAIVQGHGYRGGYAYIAAGLATMTLAFALTRRWWNERVEPSDRHSDFQSNSSPSDAHHDAQTKYSPGAVDALRSRNVWLHILVFALYTGFEASVGQWCFTWMRDIQRLDTALAGYLTAAYWASLTLGRFVLGAFVGRVGPERLLRLCAIAVVLSAALFGASRGLSSQIGLLALGLALAPFFPTLMAQTPSRVGSDLARYSVGFQVSAATLGASLAPAAIGLLVSSAGSIAIGTAILVLGVSFAAVHEVLNVAQARPQNSED
jgi:fucose permease